MKSESVSSMLTKVMTAILCIMGVFLVGKMLGYGTSYEFMTDETDEIDGSGNEVNSTRDEDVEEEYNAMVGDANDADISDGDEDGEDKEVVEKKTEAFVNGESEFMKGLMSSSEKVSGFDGNWTSY